MKRYLVPLLALFLAGCSGSAGTENIPDTETVCTELSALYDGEIVRQEKDDICIFLNLEEDMVAEAAGGWLEGAPEQFFYYVQCTDEKAAMDVKEAMDHYLTLMTDSAALYSPEQLELISNGYTAVKGTAAVVAVCEDADRIRLKITELFGN
ncbi:MAG: DUF4358 domain-containing protein [Solobacterium sp.]|nr:DUF4358 domain-containing protein [Solobacterium sp.]